MRAVRAALGRQAAQFHGALVGLQEPGVHLARQAHSIRAQQQIAQRNAFKGTEIRGILDGGLLEAVQRLFESLACAAAPEVPALFHQVVGVGYVQTVAQLRPVGDPEAEFSQGFFHFADGDGHGVLGD